MLKEVLLIMWAMVVGLLVSWAVMANLFLGADHNVLVVAASAIIAPPLALGAFALVIVGVWSPFHSWRRTRAGTGSAWHLGDYLLSPVHLTRLHRGWGWRRHLGTMTGDELRILLMPYYEARYDPILGRSVEPTIARTTRSAYKWLAAGLDPTLLVACLHVGIADEALDAHRTGARLLDEPAIRVMAALRTTHRLDA